MDKSMKTKSWTFVIVLTIFLWPVGLYFLVQKLRYDKSANFKSPKTLYIIGGFMAVVGFSGVSKALSGEKTVGNMLVPLSFSDIASYLLIGICFIVGAVFVVNRAVMMSRQKRNYKKYIELIVNKEVTSIETLSAKLSIAPDQVVKDIESMMEKGIFSNIHIDRARSVIVFDKTNQENINSDIHNCSYEERSVVCPSCGARNTVFGLSSRCEYCGTVLK